MTTAALPKWRDDLIVQGQPEAQGDSVIVKDPVTGEFFRLGVAEYFVAQQLDGRTSPDEVRRRMEARFGGPIAPETLRSFIHNLEKGHLLGAAPPAPRRKRVRGSLLYLRFPLVDPARQLDWLIAHARFFFTPAFVVLSAVVILLAAATLVENWGALAAAVPDLYQVSSIPLAVGVLFLLIVAHEFAHGLTCRYFGGQVREMGFLLMYFAPAMYCNVSDAWLFPEKRKRLWVGFAGPYFELFLWALAMLAWRFTAEETWINRVALVVVLGSGIKTLLNFNPLIKWDGYYLLSDYLDIPNLRKKSFRYVGDRLKALFGAIDRPGNAESARHRRVYLTYGVLATVYSLSLLTFITMEWGTLLIERGQPALLALLVGLVGARLRHRVRGLMGKPAAEEDGDGEGARRPSSGRSSRRRRRRGLWLAFAATLVAALFAFGMQLRVAGPVAVLPEENADVRAAVEGIVQRVYVDEGDSVTQGQVIARLSADGVTAELRSTEAEIQEARANLQKLEVGPRRVEIDVARTAVAKAEDRLQYARSRLAMFRQLFERNAATRPEFEQAEELATTAENELSEARGQLNVLLAGTRPEEIAAMRARLSQLESRQTHLEDQIGKLEVVSPVDGIVATPSRELRAMQRQLVTRGALIAKVYDFRTITAQIRIPEKEIADVQVGYPVELRARAFPSRTFQGTVTAIATAVEGLPRPDAESSASGAAAPGTGKVFIVTTRIQNDGLLLKPGMTGHAKVYCGYRRFVQLITRRIVRTFKVEVWSWW